VITEYIIRVRSALFRRVFLPSFADYFAVDAGSIATTVIANTNIRRIDIDEAMPARHPTVDFVGNSNEAVAMSSNKEAFAFLESELLSGHVSRCDLKGNFRRHFNAPGLESHTLVHND